MSRLHDHYKEVVGPQLRSDFNYGNVMEVPRLEKIVINMGVGEAVVDSKKIDAAAKEITQIAGQKPIVIKARKSAHRLVQGVNIVKRHTRPSQSTTGGIAQIEAPIHVSNLAHIDPDGGKATRVGYKFLEDNRKVRVARRSGEMID